MFMLVEEWGCNFGADAFMTDVDSDSRLEALSQPNNVVGMDEVQGEWELDDLVNDLHKEWSQHEGKKDGTQNPLQFISTQLVGVEDGTKVFKVQQSSVLQPLSKPKSDSAITSFGNNQLKHDARPKETNNPGPWSIDWISNQQPTRDDGVVFSSTCNNGNNKDLISEEAQFNSSPSNMLPKKKKGVLVKHSIGFMKRIARMPANDRTQILHILKKQKRKRKERIVNHRSKATPDSTSDSSKNSTSSVNKDWENWVLLHGKADVVAADVREDKKAQTIFRHRSEHHRVFRKSPMEDHRCPKG